MKKYLIPILAFLLLACGDDTASPTLEGRWQLFEVLADPGDGSGTFKSVESDEEIKFFPNGSIATTFSICAQFSDGPPVPGSGTYDTVKMIIIPENCIATNPPLEYHYELDKNGHLIVYFRCIERCGHKYRKIGSISNNE